jgi:5'-nucleotidase
MKKLFALLLCALFVFSACSADKPPIEEEAVIAGEELSEAEEIDQPENTEEPDVGDDALDVPQEVFPQFKLTILHTNDLHGRLENMPKYYTIIQQVRAEEANVLLLDGGDLYRRGPYEHLNGAVETEILNAMGYNAMAFGNNDFPLSDEELYDVSEHTILQLAEFAVLCGNVTIDGEYIEGIEPFIIVDFEGINIVIIGITSMKPHDREFDISKRALFSDPVQTLSELAEETKALSDIQIVLSHAGINADMQMKGVSAIISADDHIKTTFPRLIIDGGRAIPVVQAGGEQDHSLGRLDLFFELRDGEWVLFDFNGFLYPLDDVIASAEILAILEKYDEPENDDEAFVFEEAA